MRPLLLLSAFVLPVRADDVIDRTATDALKSWDVPGVALAIVHGGRTVAVKAYGVQEHGKNDALSIDHVFPLASCTKAFTAALVARLADEGRLSFDDPVRKHLPSFHLSDPNADALVTLRDLLSHRTGVGGHDLLWYRAPWSNAEVLKRIEKLPLNEPFRGAYQYSTLMYLAAGQAAANAAGQPWGTALKEKIIDPLGMKTATFTTKDPAFVKAPKAIGHRRDTNGKIEVMPRYEVAEVNPAGSINLTIGDMAPWLHLHLNSGEWNGQRLVSAANLGVTHSPQMVIPMDAAMKRFHPETVQLSYAMGWIVSDYRGVKVLSHGGMIDGFRTQVVLVPEYKLGFALFNNLHDNKMNLALANNLIDHFLKLPAKDWNGIFLKAVADEQAEKKAAWEQVNKRRKVPAANEIALFPRLAASYSNLAYGPATVTEANGALTLKWSSFQTPLEPWGDGVFRCTEGFLENQFAEFQIQPANGPRMRLLEQVFEAKP